MKKGENHIVDIVDMKYPNVGVAVIEGHRVSIKQALMGQKVEIRISRNSDTKREGQLKAVIAPGPKEVPSFCEHFGKCGGCFLQTMPYAEQTALKEFMVGKLFKDNGFVDFDYNPIVPSPEIYEYRNKMEFSFGDEEKGGELNLGMHKKGRIHDVVTTELCHLCDSDFRAILKANIDFFRANGIIKFNRHSLEGFLRHLVIRKGIHTGEILVGLSSSTEPFPLEEIYIKMLLDLPLKGQIVGIIQIPHDASGDAVRQGDERTLYGRDYYMEKLMGLDFKVSFFSFFQTNVKGAELLYSKALSLIEGSKDKVLFDLFSGTGTIGQIAAPSFKQVIGIELIADAVEAANENAKLNGIENARFIAGDVFKVLETLEDKPDVIIVDPPRAGIQEKAIEKIASYGVEEIVYISCNPKTLVQDLVVFKHLGYKVVSAVSVDMFGHTTGIETIVKIQKKSM